MRDKLYSYHREYGYSPHSLVAISDPASGWEAKRAHGAVAYLEVGRTWLAAEPLTAEKNLGLVTAEFLEHAESLGRFAVFTARHRANGSRRRCDGTRLRGVG